MVCRSRKEQGQPRVCASRGLPESDPSRDQFPVAPPTRLKSWAPNRQFDIPQPRHEREGFGRFGRNIKAFRSLDQKKGSLIRTHGKLRRREVHPVHRSCLVNVSEIQEARHTVAFPCDQSQMWVQGQGASAVAQETIVEGQSFDKGMDQEKTRS